MTAKSKFRGLDIEHNGREWIFSEDGSSVEDNWYLKKCGDCGFMTPDNDHDPCIRDMPFAMNACCGHGVAKEAYFQFRNGFCVRGYFAKILFKILKGRSMIISYKDKYEKLKEDIGKIKSLIKKDNHGYYLAGTQQEIEDAVRRLEIKSS